MLSFHPFPGSVPDLPAFPLRRLRRTIDFPTFSMKTLKYVFKEDGEAIRIVDDTLQLKMTPQQQQQMQQQRQVC